MNSNIDISIGWINSCGIRKGVFNLYCGNEGKVIAIKIFVFVCCG